MSQKDRLAGDVSLAARGSCCMRRGWLGRGRLPWFELLSNLHGLAQQGLDTGPCPLSWRGSVETASRRAAAHLRLRAPAVQLPCPASERSYPTRRHQVAQRRALGWTEVDLAQLSASFADPPLTGHVDAWSRRKRLVNGRSDRWPPGKGHGWLLDPVRRQGGVLMTDGATDKEGTVRRSGWLGDVYRCEPHLRSVGVVLGVGRGGAPGVRGCYHGGVRGRRRECRVLGQVRLLRRSGRVRWRGCGGGGTPAAAGGRGRGGPGRWSPRG